MPIYMKYEGVNGPLTGKYQGWIELESCQIGSYQSNPSGKSVTSDVTVTKHSDSSSTSLFKEAAQGTGKKVTIDFVKDETAYLSIELEKAVIFHYSIDKGFEILALSFTKITYSTKPVKASYEPEHINNRVEWGQFLYQNTE